MLGFQIFAGKWIRQEKASVSVEFAMVGLGFIMLMIGIIEVGRLVWTTNVIDYAIDESARYAVLHQDASSSDVELYARDMLDNYFVPAGNLNILVNTVTSANVDFIEIEGSYTFQSLSSSVLPAALSEVNLSVNSRRPIYAYDDEASN